MPFVWCPQNFNLPAATLEALSEQPSLAEGSITDPLVAAAGRRLTIPPGESRTVTVVVAWYFPNWPGWGKYSTNRFASATDVVEYVSAHREKLIGLTETWHETFYDTTLPHWLMDRIGRTVCNLATNTAHRWASGMFYAWEGVFACHGTCTHVWGYAQAHARLFPELARSLRTMRDYGRAFQPDGLVHFRWPGGNDFYAADGQLATILNTYREHLISADMSFLRSVYPKMAKALEYMIAQDAADGSEDGRITVAQHQTYDTSYYGHNPLIGSLYIAALRAGAEMARDIGDDASAGRWTALADKARDAMAGELFDGEYYIQNVDLTEHPQRQVGKGCLSDQLLGQSWAYQLGLGDILPGEQLEKASDAIWRYNVAVPMKPYMDARPGRRPFADTDEIGLITCTWPKSRYLRHGSTYHQEVWTGIEYQVAAQLAWSGQVDRALALCRAIHDRYHPAKRNPFNEIEYGDHYARALASWGVLIGLSGFEYNGPAGVLGLAPRITPEDFRAPFTAAQGWGTLVQKRTGDGEQTNEVLLRYGKLRLRELRIGRYPYIHTPQGAKVSATVTLAGKEIDCQVDSSGGTVTLRFPKPIMLQADESLAVRLNVNWPGK